MPGAGVFSSAPAPAKKPGAGQLQLNNTDFKLFLHMWIHNTALLEYYDSCTTLLRSRTASYNLLLHYS